jgi:L-lactate dehydrogenase complex protein LldE
LLRGLGVEVSFPQEQTCCGQPAFNSGYQTEARELARRFVRAFGNAEAVVVPSGSCTSFLRIFSPGLFDGEPALRHQMEELAPRVHELSQYLVNVLGVTDVGAVFRKKVAYHPSCHLTRELGAAKEPVALLSAVKGLERVELPQAETCCGFGGTFAVKFAHLSEAMLDDKVRNVQASGAEVLVGADMSCLMHIGGAITRRRLPITTMHLAELLVQREA